MKKCSKIQLHNFSKIESGNDKCKECGKTVKELYKEYKGQFENELMLLKMLRYAALEECPKCRMKSIDWEEAEPMCDLCGWAQ